MAVDTMNKLKRASTRTPTTPFLNFLTLPKDYQIMTSKSSELRGLLEILMEPKSAVWLASQGSYFGLSQMLRALPSPTLLARHLQGSESDSG